MLAVAAAACEDKKAEDIRILALDPAESGLSDYFLICTGTNDRQTVAITDEIEIRLKREFGAYPNAVEGRRQGEWILMDYVDFIVHVFLPERRAFYGLERLRSNATTISVEDLNAEIKSAIKAERAGKKTKVAVLDDTEGATDEQPPTTVKRKTPTRKSLAGADTAADTAVPGDAAQPSTRAKKATPAKAGKIPVKAVKAPAKAAKAGAKSVKAAAGTPARATPKTAAKKRTEAAE